MSEKKIRCIFTIEPALKEEAEKRASKRRMTFSAYLRELIVEDLSEDNLTLADEIQKLKERMDEIERRFK